MGNGQSRVHPLFRRFEARPGCNDVSMVWSAVRPKRRRPSVGVAPADQCEVSGIDGEAVPGRDGIGQALKVVDRDVNGQSTHLAGQVMVLHMIREVENGWPVAQVHVMDESRLLERIDRPIHRRDVDR